MSESEEKVSAEAAEHAIEAVSGFATRIGRSWRDPAGLLDLIDDALVGMEDLLSELGDRSRREFMDVPDLIQRDVGHLPLFEAATLSHAATYLAGSIWKPCVPEHARYLFAGLATRAVSTVREIAILLDHGYQLGAKSRWRTLSEILVVARVIAMGDRYTATRYREHRWIVLAMERRKTGQTAWTGDLPSPEVMRRRLVRRFGAEYSGLYGWAARVTARRLGIGKPGWKDLQALAGVHEHAWRVHDAHHAVHGADALGLLGIIDAGSGHFHAGASGQGVLEVARDTTRLFRQALSAIFEMCLKYSDERKPQILQGIVEAHLFNLEQRLNWKVISTDTHAREEYLTKMNDWFGGVAESSNQQDDVDFL
ncbi:DUF5677 domain-containing protein [Saxibacter everestensis]|uniref:DUF5677 domain-containing protein n=1 Tax=Saxibacter everestensis TaxID=2909229 RepID=A0ABY8QNU8_9MICO|nr:DUF5677 domain-containing protein [Brevibacteriaceae bacterium ZFBP1038]